eukprot:m.94461 g.94461  ORF g.94461 m.94461 type:complete len:83 (+) comp8922_c0_seq22:1967-2215(+)
MGENVDESALVVSYDDVEFGLSQTRPSALREVAVEVPTTRYVCKKPFYALLRCVGINLKNNGSFGGGLLSLQAGTILVDKRM